MQRLFILTVLLSILFISCGGPRVVIHDQKSSQTLSSSPSASVTGQASDSDTATEQDQRATFVMKPSSVPSMIQISHRAGVPEVQQSISFGQ